jgi:hypothetical protein
MPSSEHGGEFHHRDAEGTKLREGWKIGASDVGNPVDVLFRPAPPIPRLGGLKTLMRRTEIGQTGTVRLHRVRVESANNADPISAICGKIP